MPALAYSSLLALFLLGASTGSPVISDLLFLVNLLAFWLYAQDKTNAQRGGARVPEMVLHLVAVVGGAGACAARYWLRHKTRKSAFTLSTMAGAVVLWAALIVLRSLG